MTKDTVEIAGTACQVVTLPSETAVTITLRSP